jgi:spermidine synthase
MSIVFEEIDFQTTPLGDISLRRRSEPRFDNIILYEVKLGDEFLMSSLFTESEIQLSKLGLAALKSNYSGELDIVVGGLGLGYTAVAALEDPAVKSLRVIEVMQPVIDWHQRGLVPLGDELTADSRCTLVHDDFFAVASAVNGSFDKEEPEKLVHAVLLDIDHSPSHWLNEGNSSFYSVPALENLSKKILPGGIFGVWSNDPPDNDFINLLESVFQSTESHVVSFPNPYTEGESSCTVYVTQTKY